MGQMVCGSCRELLAYPRGAVHVQCAGCRTINLVLEGTYCFYFVLSLFSVYNSFQGAPFLLSSSTMV